jgi:hypothetical protein
MTRFRRRFRVAGIVVALFVGTLASANASANEETRLIPVQRVAASVLFFPYPAIVSTAGTHPVKPHRSKYLFTGPMHALDAGTPKYDSAIHPDLGQLARLYPPALSPNSVAAPARSRDDITDDDDEWHFQANPQLGVNHEHEKGMTFSVRHDF